MQQLYKRVVRGEYKPIPKQYSDDLRNIISMMLVTNPEKRISIGKSEVLTVTEQLLALPEILKVGAEYGLQQSLMSSMPSQEATLDSINTNQTDQQLLIKTIYTKKVLSEVQEQLPKPRFTIPTDPQREQYSSKLSLPLKTKLPEVQKSPQEVRAPRQKQQPSVAKLPPAISEPRSPSEGEAKQAPLRNAASELASKIRTKPKKSVQDEVISLSPHRAPTVRNNDAQYLS